METRRSDYLLRRPYGSKDVIGKQYEIEANDPNNQRNVLKFDIETLIRMHPEPEVWIEHLENDLMKFWNTDSAKTFQGDLFPTYRSNSGEIITNDESTWSVEIKAALASEDTEGLIDIGINYVRAHSRQTYAYGIAYHMTGKEEYLEMCKKGAYALTKAMDGNNGMFTKQNIDTGKWGDPRNKRTCQDLAYGITGMGMYYFLTHDESMLFNILKAKDYIFNTYFDEGKGYFTWYPKNSCGNDIEIVAQLDQVYAYMIWLTPSLPEPYQSQWKVSLKKIADILIHRFYSERYGFFWGQDTNSAVQQLGKDHTDFGHSVKTMWLIYKIGVLIDDMTYVMFGRNKMNRIIQSAYTNQRGGCWAIKYKKNGKLDMKHKEWWQLAELDQACAILALNDPSYLDYLNNTYNYWFKYMVDKKYGEIWHMVLDADGAEEPVPVERYPKIHSWKASLHSFEHVLFGYMTSSQIKSRDFTVYYAFKSKKEVVPERVSPYLFKANIAEVKKLNEIEFMEDGNKKIKVTFNNLR